MASDRMIRAAMRESEKVNSWPYDVRYFWTQLWGYCDDFGRGRRDPRLVKAGVMPLDDGATFEVVDGWMCALESAGVIHVFEVGGKTYFECVNWEEAQEPPYRKKTDIPDRFGVIPKPGKRSETFQKNPSEREVEGEREREGESAAAPPSPFCKKHPGGTDDPCRACGNARRRRDEWEAAEKVKPTPVPRAAKPGDGHKHAPDQHGYCPVCGERAEVAA